MSYGQRIRESRERLGQRLATEGVVPIHRHGRPVAVVALNGTGYELQRDGLVFCGLRARSAVEAVGEAERTVGNNPLTFTHERS